jgi:hypothetical protein
MIAGVEVRFHAFLTSPLYGSEWQFHSPNTLPQEKQPRISNCTGDDLGPALKIEPQFLSRPSRSLVTVKASEWYTHVKLQLLLIVEPVNNFDGCVYVVYYIIIQRLW